MILSLPKFSCSDIGKLVLRNVVPDGKKRPILKIRRCSPFSLKLITAYLIHRLGSQSILVWMDAHLLPDGKSHWLSSIKTTAPPHLTEGHPNLWSAALSAVGWVGDGMQVATPAAVHTWKSFFSCMQIFRAKSSFARHIKGDCKTRENTHCTS